MSPTVPTTTRPAVPAPRPTVPRVLLRPQPAATWAVARCCGSWSPADAQEHLGELKAALQAAGRPTHGAPAQARCNRPFTTGLTHRREIRLGLR